MKLQNASLVWIPDWNMVPTSHRLGEANTGGKLSIFFYMDANIFFVSRQSQTLMFVSPFENEDLSVYVHVFRGGSPRSVALRWANINGAACIEGPDTFTDGVVPKTAPPEHVANLHSSDSFGVLESCSFFVVRACPVRSNAWIRTGSEEPFTLSKNVRCGRRLPRYTVLCKLQSAGRLNLHSTVYRWTSRHADGTPAATAQR